MTNVQKNEEKSSDYYGCERKPLLDFIPKDAGSLLDVGCGGGAFGAMLKANRDIEVWGVEPVLSAAANARSQLDNVVHSMFDENTDLPDNYFDVITFNDSLEHFPYPGPPLELARKKLNRKGVIVCSIPNVRYIENIKKLLVDKDWKYTEAGVLDNTHLRFFTKKSMIRTLTQSGFVVEAMQGINPHHWSGWKIRLLDFLFHKNIEDMKYLQYVVVASPK